MGTTEGMLMWWFVECGAVSGAILGAIVGPLMAKHQGGGIGHSAIYGMGAVGGSGMLTGLLGLVVGCTVHLVDLVENPGLLQGCIYLGLGFLVGTVTAIVPSLLGGFVGGLFLKS